MSKQFIKGNVYVFIAKKIKQKMQKSNKYYTWHKAINGNKVTMVSQNDGMVGQYRVMPEWCKCIKNNNPKIESEEI